MGNRFWSSKFQRNLSAAQRRHLGRYLRIVTRHAGAAAGDFLIGAAAGHDYNGPAFNFNRVADGSRSEGSSMSHPLTC
jgi:hypothetical protein